jgi:signal transduction histidine kinase
MTYATLAGILLAASVSAHATRSPPVLAATLLAAGSALAGGCAAVLTRRYSALAVVGLTVGVVWLGSSLVGWTGGPHPVRGGALVGGAFLPALLVHLVLLAPGRALPDGLRRTVLALAYGMSALVTAVTVLTRDPLRDPYCWHDCNLRLLAALPDRGVAELATATGRVLVLTLAVVTASLTILRSTGGPAPAWTSLVVSGPAALLAAGLSVAAGAVLTDPPERSSGPWFQVAHWVQALAVLLLGLGLGLLALRQRRRRVALQHLSERVDAVPPVGSLESHLARALDDSGLQVAHWLPQSRCFVDSTGARVGVEPDGAGPRVELRRAGELLAVVTLDRPAVEEEDIAGQLGAVTRLALDNERHHAEVRAQLTELRRSRERIVEAGDASRRALERDLHDGIQAELVALLIEAGRALEQARAGDDPGAVELLEETVTRIGSAVARLRDITHGIYPAELAEEGLEAALWTVTDEAPVPVVITVDLTRRPPVPVEQAAYHVVLEALDGVTGPEALRLRVEGGEERVVLRVGPLLGPAPERLCDRVGALDGTIEWSDREWEVVLPCASS